MKCIHRKAVQFLLSLLFLIGSTSVFSEDTFSLLPTPECGSYSTPQMVSFSKPAQKRLFISLDGGSFFEPVSPLLLSVKAGEEHEFVIQTEIRSLIPDSPALSTQRFIWRIDMKAPAPPFFSSMRVNGGRNTIFSLTEPGRIQYQMYHPYTSAVSSGSIESGASLFIPDGSFVCAFGIDRAGNSGAASSIPDSLCDTQDVPFKVINPVPGNWANSQVLLVDSSPDTEVRYSLDGSDPSLSGLAYSEPVLLDTTGITTLRVLSIDTNGKRYEQRILYTVTPREIPSGCEFAKAGSIIELGDFAEIQIPSGYMYSISGDSPSLDGGKSILFSAIRGVRRFFPLAISDGTIHFRFVCARGLVTPSAPVMSNASPATEIPATEIPATEIPAETGPQISIQDWYYLSFDNYRPLYYSFDSKNWIEYSKPFFIDRAVEQTVFWYSTSWKDSAVQTVVLPAKPQITGVPENLFTGKPVLLTVSNTPCLLYYEVGAEYFSKEPSAKSPELSSGILFEVPPGESSVFSVRILVMYQGLVQGELFSRFTIDRLAPRSPSPGISNETLYSRVPVVVSPSGEDRIEVSITGDPCVSDGKTFTLQGDINRSVEYTLTFQSIDKAGNTSPLIARTVTVDLNALYVDSAMVTKSVRDGSPLSPYSTLDEALSAVRGKGSWRIYVKGNATLSAVHTIQAKVTVVGSNAVLMASPATSLVVFGGSLSFSGCSIRQEFLDTTSRTSSVLFDIRKGDFFASGLDVQVSGISTGSILRTSLSKITCTDSRFMLSATEYALPFDITDSIVNMNSCSLSASGRNASGLSLTSSKADITSSSFFVTATSAGRAIESWSSELSLKDVLLERKGTDNANRDTAFWFDAHSRILSESGMKINGFWKYTPDGTR